MPPAEEYQVRVQFDERDAGQIFGTFSSIENAEQCVIALATRLDVLSAKIEKGT